MFKRENARVSYLEVKRKKCTVFSFLGLYELLIYWLTVRGVYLTGIHSGEGERKDNKPALRPLNEYNCMC